MSIHKLSWMAILVLACQSPQPTHTQEASVALAQNQNPACEWCGTSEAPSDVSWRTVIPPAKEPGEKLIISGTVYQEDGKSPAQDVIVYVYHTNIQGVYPTRGDEKGNALRHGYLRGWMKTDAQGRYAFETIRPAPYETHGGEPAHIHYVLEAPGYPEYWLTGLWFEDDPRVTPELLAKVPRDGGFSNLTALEKGKDGILRGKRDLKLQKF